MTSSDFTSITYGSGYVNSNGNLSINVTPANDSEIEGDESFWVEVYSTYDDGTPVSMTLDLSFKEIQPIYDIDYDARPGTQAVGY